MKKITIGIVALIIVAGMYSCKSGKNATQVSADTMKSTVDTMKFENELDSVSYALGINLANNVKKSGMEEMNTDALGKAIKATLAGKEVEMTEQQASQILNDYFGRLQKEMAEKLMKPGRDFLAENATKSGVVTKPSGLQYKVIKSGDGKTPGPTDKVTTHYHGTFIDGKVFDSSIDRGQPASFGVNQVIKGWTEALQLMKEGDEWELYIPYDLAYGAQGRPGIPPYSTLIFRIQLLKVN